MFDFRFKCQHSLEYVLLPVFLLSFLPMVLGCVGRSEDSLQKSILSSHRVGSWGSNSATILDCKPLCSPRQLSTPLPSALLTNTCFEFVLQSAHKQWLSLWHLHVLSHHPPVSPASLRLVPLVPQVVTTSAFTP